MSVVLIIIALELDKPYLAIRCVELRCGVKQPRVRKCSLFKAVLSERRVFLRDNTISY